MSKHFFQPVSPFIINQSFAENKACVDIATGKNVITCDGTKPPKGFKSLYGAAGHKGIDLHALHGQEVYAACSGVVAFIDTEPKTGLDVKVVSEFEGKKYRHIYEHLLGYNVKVGQTVTTGDLIGWADNTGWSSGNHLHFQVELWINNKWVPVDPLPLMEPIFALKFAGMWRQVKEIAAKLAEYLADRARGV